MLIHFGSTQQDAELSSPEIKCPEEPYLTETGPYLTKLAEKTLKTRCNENLIKGHHEGSFEHNDLEGETTNLRQQLYDT